MRYLGGKSRAGKHIAKFLNGALGGTRRFIEPFVGGFNIVPHVKTTGAIQCADIKRPLVAMYQDLQHGWDPPQTVTKEEYAAAKSLPDTDPLKAFIGFGCSFGGKWFGGYARGERLKSGAPRNYAANGRNSLIKALPHICRVGDFLAGDYRFLFTGAQDAVIYCDPPYANTTKYSTGAFDHVAFWAWCQDMATNNDVFVSEYTCPVPHTVALELTRDRSLNVNSDTITERLFKVHPRVANPNQLSLNL